VTQYFPVVIERESNGTLSAYVAGLPGVYAAADSLAAVKRGIRSALAAHLEALDSVGQTGESGATLLVLRRDGPKTRAAALRFVGIGALLGRRTSQAKKAAARVNGRRGGRPRNAARPHTTSRAQR
jgi:predicted RNase H-like HicB family nuclease